jgi:hypothetical protein
MKTEMTWECNGCGTVMDTYAKVGYDGPADPAMSNTCHPFMPWATLCVACSLDKENVGTYTPPTES